MSADNLKRSSETDWARLERMTDEEIDTSDVPPLDPTFFEKAKFRLPEDRVSLIAKVDPDILAWFQAQGAGYQQRINAALRLYVDAHRKEGL